MTAFTIPTMASLARVKSTGLTAISTFSGSGASCLGLRLAGFDVRAASEFIPAARETYAANFPTTPIDPRDIRDVTGAELLALGDLEPGSLDLLEGSPPCASFSLAGARERLWGQVKAYSETTQRVDDLFDEYVRLVDELRPRVFVAENVAGFVRGSALLYARRIMRRAERLGYVVRAKVLDAQHYGVPQSRRRTILLGVRSDLGVVPSFPKPSTLRPFTLRDAVAGTCWEPDVGRVRYGPHYPFHDQIDDRRFHSRLHSLVNPDEPFPTLLGARESALFIGPPGRKNGERLPIDLAKRLSTFPADFVLVGSHARQWERIGRAVPPLFAAAVACHVRDTILRPAQERAA